MQRLGFDWRRNSFFDEKEDNRRTVPTYEASPFQSGISPVEEKKVKLDDIEEEYTEKPTFLEERLTRSTKHDIGKLKSILQTSITYLTNKNSEGQKWQYSSHEREMRKSLNDFFSELAEKFDKDKNNRLSFNESLRMFLKKNCQNKKEKENNFILQSLNIVEDLSFNSNEKAMTNSSKLKTFISMLSNQLALLNKKLFITKQMGKRLMKEKQYLQENDKSSLETQNRWCQIDLSLISSDITIKIKSAQKIRSSQSFAQAFCLIKLNNVPIGKTSSVKGDNYEWNTTLTLELTKDFVVDNFTFEVYNDVKPPILLGSCQISLEELFDTTLFNQKFSGVLPLLSASNGVNLSTTESSLELKKTLQTEVEVNDNYKQSLGQLSVSFEVRLDPSFMNLVEKLRIKRLENIETIIKENYLSLHEQLSFLKTLTESINTIEVNEVFGLTSKIQELPGIKKRENSMCGICFTSNSESCNLF